MPFSPTTLGTLQIVSRNAGLSLSPYVGVANGLFYSGTSAMLSWARGFPGGFIVGFGGNGWGFTSALGHSDPALQVVSTNSMGPRSTVTRLAFNNGFYFGRGGAMLPPVRVPLVAVFLKRGFTLACSRRSTASQSSLAPWLVDLP